MSEKSKESTVTQPIALTVMPASVSVEVVAEVTEVTDTKIKITDFVKTGNSPVVKSEGAETDCEGRSTKRVKIETNPDIKHESASSV